MHQDPALSSKQSEVDEGEPMDPDYDAKPSQIKRNTYVQPPY